MIAKVRLLGHQRLKNLPERIREQTDLRDDRVTGIDLSEQTRFFSGFVVDMLERQDPE